MTKHADALRELRKLTDTELDAHLRAQRRKLFEVRFQQATGQVENHRQVREIRREIARAMTIQIEIARGINVDLVAPAAPAPAVTAPRPRRRAEPVVATPAPEEDEPAVEPIEDEAATDAVAEQDDVVAETDDEADVSLSETEPTAEGEDVDE